MTVQLLTFLFTDLEGSTRLWEDFPEEMKAVMARHDSLLRRAVVEHRGSVVKTTGDGLHASFPSALDAAAAAVSAQEALRQETWPDGIGQPRVRMGLHTGEAQARDGDYYGPSLNRAARIMAAGHGGQVLVSEITCGLISDYLPAELTLEELGSHGLRDLARPERLFQLSYPGMPAGFPPLKTLDSYKHNLPLQLTSFISRERELNRVKELLAGTRLLTLLGPGGTGKTRLMLQVAADLLEDFPDGIWLVELAPLADPELILDQSASVLGVSQQPGRPLIDLLTGFLRRKQLLLLLDNVEHLVAECAAFAEHLLRSCPNIKILVTGRESLFIDGEVTLQIPSMGLPARNEVEDLERSEAVQLFVDRVLGVRPDFELNGSNAPYVVEIVRRLDGIPMALELAAARVRAMSVEQIAQRLNDRFRLLTGGRRTAVPRQQTLQALIEWSWNLLDEEERILLRRLSVFSGGWTLNAAERVAGFDGLFVLDLLDQLVGKSLVVAELDSAGSIRYRMLESIHQFAQDRLVEAGEAETLRNRHLDYIIAFFQEVRAGLRSRDMFPALEKVNQEIENFRSARDWSFEIGPEKTLELVAILDISTRFWLGIPEIRRWMAEVVQTTQRYVVEAQSDELRRQLACAQIHLGAAEIALGERNAASTLVESCRVARDLGMNRELVFGLSMLMIRASFSGDLKAAAELSAEAVDIARRENFDLELVMALGSLTPALAFQSFVRDAVEKTREAIRLALRSGNPWVEAMAENEQARISIALEEWEDAVAHFRRAIELFKNVQDEGLVVICQSDMAHILRRMGRTEEANRIYNHTILQWADIQHLSAVAHQLECFSYLDLLVPDYGRAARLLGAADQLREKANVARVMPIEVAEYQQALVTIENGIGRERLGEALRQGSRMTMDEAVDYARNSRG